MPDRRPPLDQSPAASPGSTGVTRPAASDASGDSSRIWADSHRLIEQMEIEARTCPALRRGESATHFENLLAGFHSITGAQATHLYAVEDGQPNSLSQIGLAVFDAKVDTSGADGHPHWSSDGSTTGARLRVSLPLLPSTQLTWEARFAAPIAVDRRAASEQLASALMDLASSAYLRCRVIRLQSHLGQMDDRESFVASLYRGSNLTETWTSIAVSVQRMTEVDRVSILRIGGDHGQHGGSRMIATSTPSHIDHRADHVRWMQQMVDTYATTTDIFSGTADVEPRGDADRDKIDAWQTYRKQTDCRDIRIEFIGGIAENASSHRTGAAFPAAATESTGPVAAMVLERFGTASDTDRKADRGVQRDADSTGSNTSDQPASLDRYTPHRWTITRAIQDAIVRADSQTPTMAGRGIQWASRQSKISIAIIAAIVIAAALIPVPFNLPVEGRVVPVRQSRLFSPAAGVVSEVLVSDGETVRSGQELVVMRSPDLDLKQQSLLAALDTAQTKRESLSALRSTTRDTQSSADARVIESEIIGLQRQLDAIHHQQKQLTLRSPIDGVVDQWNLVDSLSSRPVTHGQYLLSVIAESEGWNAELDIPDQAIAYLPSHVDQPVQCTFKLRSDPTQTYQGTIADLSLTADLNAEAKSVVRGRVPIRTGDQERLRPGATLVAKIHCGNSPAGFVYLRSLIQWYRRQIWF
ncbi:HlyD family secretion protein [Rubripirellula lacrimiformis]|uniref:HlyD family secretion protein n=1 Tax=Rubripirellula lacrimiformis TaxID=1930273 RepID=A0A517N7S6_9BACT|nr:HlyD family efflux transporter periplasmic adaptor subunit [Rubripirellula lacrimiformis]QDT03160.1 HlyD family secretion protein [Rubripirellula lacrimiformis]